MLPKPFGCPGGCAVLQNIDDLAPLEVNDYGSVSATPLPAPIINAYRQYSRVRAETGDHCGFKCRRMVSSPAGMPKAHRSFSRSAARSVSER
jgi:hypothetical protein